MSMYLKVYNKKTSIMNNQKVRCSGKIPIIVIIVLALAAGGGSVFLFSGKIRETTSSYLVVLLIGIILGLFILPNLKSLIRWMKEIRNEVKK